MKKIKKIMVALGFTSYAQETFDYAVCLAEGIGAEKNLPFLRFRI